MARKRRAQDDDGVELNESPTKRAKVEPSDNFSSSSALTSSSSSADSGLELLLQFAEQVKMDPPAAAASSSSVLEKKASPIVSKHSSTTTNTNTDGAPTSSLPVAVESVGVSSADLSAAADALLSGAKLHKKLTGRSGSATFAGTDDEDLDDDFDDDDEDLSEHEEEAPVVATPAARPPRRKAHSVLLYTSINFSIFCCVVLTSLSTENLHFLKLR